MKSALGSSPFTTEPRWRVRQPADLIAKAGPGPVFEIHRAHVHLISAPPQQGL